MEFRVGVDAASPALEVVRDACVESDPSALVDLAPDGGAVRIATMLDHASLEAVLRHGGWPLAPGQLRQLPSVCCGGCSG